MVCKGMRSDAELTLTHHLLHNLSHTTLSHTIFHTHAHTHTPSFTHHVSQTIFRTTSSHTICHTLLCHTHPHRHGDATGKPETRDETRGSRKTSISCETSSNFDTSLPQNRCFVGGFCQFSSHLTKCHVCHGIYTLSPLDAALTMRFAKNTQHDTSKVLRLPRKMTIWTRPKCCACHENCNTSSENVAKVLRLPHKTIFHTLKKMSESHEVPHLPRETKLTRLKPPKVIPSAELTIGTAIRPSRERLRTVADGCERLRT